MRTGVVFATKGPDGRVDWMSGKGGGWHGQQPYQGRYERNLDPDAKREHRNLHVCILVRLLCERDQLAPGWPCLHAVAGRDRSVGLVLGGVREDTEHQKSETWKVWEDEDETPGLLGLTGKK